MVKFNYACVDCTCGKYERITITKPREDEEKPEFCEENQDLELKCIGEQMLGGAMKFQLMNPQQRKESLKKRAKDHAVRNHNPKDVK